jgi:hypothetical protein
MALKFKLEFFRDGTKPTQAGVYMHFEQDVPCYMDLVTKEEYSKFKPEDKCDLLPIYLQ